MAIKLFVGSLPYSMTNEELEALFAEKSEKLQENFEIMEK